MKELPVSLSNQEITQIQMIDRIRQNKYIPIVPTDKQLIFLSLDCLDAFYGGAAGGGKSIALLMAALQFIDITGYNAILLRDTMTNLSMPDSIMDVAHQWLINTDAHFLGEKKRWLFPSGATLSFGYLDKPYDHFHYQSAQFQFVGIDEAVNIRENQAKYMFSRLRKLKDNPIPIRFRCASNPPAAEQIAKGQWVKNRYVDKEIKRNDAIFIPAKMEDNPYLDILDYKNNLKELDPITRKQLEEGDWEIKRKGKLFSREWFELVDQIPNDCKRIRYWDLAATEPSKINKEPCYTVGAKLAISKDNTIYIESIIRERKEPKYIESIIRQTADMDGKEVKIYMEQEPGSSGKNTIDHYRRNILMGYAFYADKVSGSKFSRAVPLSSQSEAGNVKVVKGYWNELFFDEIELFPDGQFLDQVDACSGAFNQLNIDRSPRIRVIDSNDMPFKKKGLCQNCSTVDNKELFPVMILGQNKWVCKYCKESFDGTN